MGQTQTQLRQNQDYLLIEQLPVGNIVKHNKTQSLHFLKQYSFTAQQAYQNALNMHSLKLANKNQHILNFLHFTTKSQNSFCSTFHKIILIFQYIEYSLQRQIFSRTKDHRPFNEKQMWSVLCSCVLAAVHLIHCQGKMHCGLTPKDIRLTPSGCVKLLSHQMIGIDQNHNQSQGSPKTLALTVIQCLLLEKLTNQDNKYLEQIVQGLQCSKDMKDMLIMMIKDNVKFTQLEQHLFKLVQDDESLASHSNTPILKSQSPLNSNYKCPRIYRDQQKTKQEKQSLCSQMFASQMLTSDCEDTKSYLYLFQCAEVQIQNPDQTEQQTTEQQNQTPKEQSPQKVNSFYLKQRKIEDNLGTRQNFIKDFHEIQKIKITKSYQINALPSSRKRQNKANNQNLPQFLQNEAKTKTSYGGATNSFQNQQSLFTDPKLFSLIKSDLEDIKMRRSIGELGKFTRTQQSKTSLIVEPQVPQPPSKTTFNIQQSISSFQSQKTPIIGIVSPLQNHVECHNNKINIGKQQPSSNWQKQPCQQVLKNNQNALRNIQMIKQLSQQYRQDDQDLKFRSNKQNQRHQKKQEKKTETIKMQSRIQSKVDNIMNDSEMGFRKKKQLTGRFQVPKYNVDHSQHQHLKVPIEPILIKQKQKTDKSARQVKQQYKVEQKSSKTVGMKPPEIEQSKRQQQFFYDYSRSRSQSISSTTRNNQKTQKEQEKLVQVNQKYNRGRYEGTKLNGKRHGFGTFYYSEGGKYVGNWKQNKMHGKGILYYPNQQVAYDGQWENDQLSGYGILFNEQVTPLRNPFDYRDWSDVQEYWVKYQGQFSQDNKQGKGKLYLVNGQRLEGYFHDDKVDGQGVLYRGDGSSVKGKWSLNKLIQMF